MFSAKPAPVGSAVFPPAVAAALAAGNVLVVIPAYNEEESLGATLRSVREQLPGAHILVVSDCSTDQTAEVAGSGGAKVVELSCKLGYGGAVQTGFKYALAHGFDFLVQIDADGQHDPRFAAALLDPVVRDVADIVIGSRFLGHANYPIPILQRLGMAIFGAIVSFVIRRNFSDPTSGFQAMNGRVMQFFARDNYPTDFPDADTIMVLVLSGFRVQEVPVVMQARTAGISMHSNLEPFYYVAKMSMAILIALLRQKRLRVQQPPVKRGPSGDHL